MYAMPFFPPRFTEYISESAILTSSEVFSGTMPEHVTTPMLKVTGQFEYFPLFLKIADDIHCACHHRF